MLHIPYLLGRESDNKAVQYSLSHIYIWVRYMYGRSNEVKHRSMAGRQCIYKLAYCTYMKMQQCMHGDRLEDCNGTKQQNWKMWVSARPSWQAGQCMYA
jgi:hypothetical protein